jgi:hypothetical protein
MLPASDPQMREFVKDQIQHWERHLQNHPNTQIRAKIEKGIQELKNLL